MGNSLIKNSLRKNFSWNFIGSLIYAITQWGLIIVITRLGSVEMVGFFSLGLAITSPIIQLTNLQLRTVQATSGEDFFEIGDYFGVRIITDVSFCIFLFILLISSNYDDYTNVIIILVGITKIIESLSDLLYGYFQQKERMELISKSTIIRGITSLLIVTITLFLTNSLIISLIGMSVCWLAVFLFYDLKNLRYFSQKLKPKFSKKTINIIKISIPLGLVVAIVSLNTNLPKIIIENLLNPEALGYFASISYFVYVGSRFINSIGNALLPRLSMLIRQNNVRAFKKYLSVLIMISFFIGLTLLAFSILIGEYILYYVYGSDFVDYKNLLIFIMIYGIFNYISYSLMVGLNAMREFAIQPYLAIIWLLASIIGLLYFVPQYGLIGAAFALIIYSVTRIITIGFLILYRLNKVVKN